MKSFTLQSVACACLLALAGTAQAQTADKSFPTFSFSGFGTISAVHSSEAEADFVGSVFQHTGAGRSQSVSFGPDSKLAGQLTAKFTPQLSGILQVVMQHQYDDSYRPQIEWANLKYEFTPDFSVRVGRIALPAFAISETRFVGFANPWVRPPIELYGMSSITSNDGIDATWVTRFGDKVNTLSGFYGSSKANLSSGPVKSNPSWGINDTLDMGSLTLRAGYMNIKLDLDLPSIAPLLNGLNALGASTSAVPVPAIQAAGAQAYALANKYSLKDIPIKITSLGASYDKGDWFLMGEYAYFTGGSFFSDSRAWFVSTGYRMGKWTPYVTLAEVNTPPHAEPGISTTGLPASIAAGANGLTAGLNSSIQGFASSQSSVSLGLRWDFMKNMAAKLQYDRVDIGANSHGRFGNTSAKYVPGGNANLVSLAVDFVF